MAKAIFKLVLRLMAVASGTHVRIASPFRYLILISIGFDRDLGVAGRAMVRTGDGSIAQKLIKIDRPSMSRHLLPSILDIDHTPSSSHPNFGHSS